MNRSMDGLPSSLRRVGTLQLSPREEASDDETQHSFASSGTLREDGSNPQLWAKDTHCSICARRFSKIKGLSRHHCRFCGKSVCDDHSTKRREHSDLNRIVRICDICEKNFIAHDLRQKLALEVSRLQAHLESVSGELQRRQGEAQETEKEIVTIEKKLTEDERLSNLRGKKLTENMLEEQSRNQRRQGIIENMSLAVKEAIDSEKIATDRFTKSSAAAESTRNDIEHIHNEIKELDTKVDASFLQMKTRIPQQIISRVLCERCQKRLFQASTKALGHSADSSETQSYDVSHGAGRKKITLKDMQSGTSFSGAQTENPNCQLM